MSKHVAMLSAVFVLAHGLTLEAITPAQRVYFENKIRPVLVEHCYECHAPDAKKLGGKLLAFNIDPDFSNVLDGLIMVDLTDTDPRVLSRYMGKEGMKEFLSHHGKEV